MEAVVAMDDVTRAFNLHRHIGLGIAALENIDSRQDSKIHAFKFAAYRGIFSGSVPIVLAGQASTYYSITDICLWNLRQWEIYIKI